MPMHREIQPVVLAVELLQLAFQRPAQVGPQQLPLITVDGLTVGCNPLECSERCPLGLACQGDEAR